MLSPEFTVDLVGLRQHLIRHFNEEEFRTLCFDLNIHYDALGGEGVEGKVRELIASLMRSNDVNRLVKYLQSLPHKSWNPRPLSVNFDNRRYELALNREQIYEAAIEAAKKGTTDNPIRRVKIYAPLGFTDPDDAKARWLSELKQLVIQHRVGEVKVVLGISDDEAMLAKAANFLVNYFFYAQNEVDAVFLRNHIFVYGIRLGDEGLGVPHGLGVLIIEDKLVILAYSINSGDDIVQRAVVIRDEDVVRDWSDWFDGHAHVPNCMFDLQNHKLRDGENLYEKLQKMLLSRGLSSDTVDYILSQRRLSWEEIITCVR